MNSYNTIAAVESWSEKWLGRSCLVRLRSLCIDLCSIFRPISLANTEIRLIEFVLARKSVQLH